MYVNITFEEITITKEPKNKTIGDLYLLGASPVSMHIEDVVQDIWEDQYKENEYVTRLGLTVLDWLEENDEGEEIYFEVPFTGFYQSEHSDRVDLEVEEHLRELPESEWDSQIELIDYKETFENIAKTYTAQLMHQIGIEAEFVELVSPRFYNYSTDRIIAKMSKKETYKVQKEVFKRRAEFREDLEDWFEFNRKHVISSIDRPISDVEAWPEWGYLQVTVAVAFLASEEIDFTIEVIGGNGAYYPAFK